MKISISVMVIFRNRSDNVNAVPECRYCNRNDSNSRDKFHFIASLCNNDSPYYHSVYDKTKPNMQT